MDKIHQLELKIKKIKADSIYFYCSRFKSTNHVVVEKIPVGKSIRKNNLLRDKPKTKLRKKS